jgi:hypothetical protein
MRHIRPITTVLAAVAAVTLALALTAGASARRIALTEQNFLASWTPTSPIAFNAAGHAIRCPVTIDGSFHSRTVSKVCGQLVGYVNRAIVANSVCTNGHFTAQTETLPWHIRYLRFSGTLPIISLLYIVLVGGRFTFETAEGILCEMGTTAEHPAVGNIEIRREGETGFLKAERLIALPEFTIPLGGGFICRLGGEVSFEGTANLTGTTAGRTRTLVTLVQ